MDIREQILVDNSKWNINYISNEIGYDPSKFRMLWEYVKSESPPLSSRSAWIIENLSIEYPALFKPYITEAIEILSKTGNSAIKRHLLKVLSYSDIPEPKLGVLFNICEGFIESSKEPVAVKVHSLQILYNISNIEQDLKPEIIAIIENYSSINSAGMKARGEILLKKLRSELFGH